jgi:hypothetical protein
MLRLAHLKARIERLNKLTMAFSGERLDIRKGNDPLFFAEREASTRGLDQAIQGAGGRAEGISSRAGSKTFYPTVQKMPAPTSASAS